MLIWPFSDHLDHLDLFWFWELLTRGIEKTLYHQLCKEPFDSPMTRYPLPKDKEITHQNKLTIFERARAEISSSFNGSASRLIRRITGPYTGRGRGGGRLEVPSPLPPGTCVWTSLLLVCRRFVRNNTTPSSLRVCFRSSDDECGLEDEDAVERLSPPSLVSVCLSLFRSFWLSTSGTTCASSRIREAQYLRRISHFIHSTWLDMKIQSS